MNTIPVHFVHAVCDSLVQSLWLGLFLATAAGLMVLCTRRSSARLRYNLLVTGLGIFAGAVLFIFFRQLLGNEINPEMTVIQRVNLPAPVSIHPGLKQGNYEIITGLLNAHANSIVLIWLLIVLAKTLQLLSGLQSLCFLRRRHTTPVNSDWEEKVKILAAQLEIRRMVGIAESGLAKVPMVIGHLKPLILIPAGMITALSPAGIEAILIHELAHIRRFDYLMNILVNSLEIVFFFNPAVLWLTALIREERENCCDDIALAHTGSKREYVQALVACQEYRLTTPAYAMAFSGQKFHLLERVKRMLSNSNSSLNIMERVVLASALLIAVLVTAAFSNADKINKLVTTMVSATPVKKLSSGQVKPANTPVYTRPLPAIRKAVMTVKDAGQLPDTAQRRIYTPEEVSELTEPQTQQLQPAPETVNPHPKDYQAYHDGTNLKKLTDDLVAEGIIKNKAELLSFKLSETEFIVNGQKIPDNTYRKFRNAYVKIPDKGKQGSWSWLYNYESGH